MTKLDAVSLRLLANGKTLSSLIYYSLVNFGKVVNKDGYQIVDRPTTLQIVLEIMNSKRNLIN